MKRERLFYGGAIVLLVAVLILGLWYKQPKTIREITGIAAPDQISTLVIRFDEQMNMEQRKLTLSAGDEGFDTLMASWMGWSSAALPPISCASLSPSCRVWMKAPRNGRGETSSTCTSPSPPPPRANPGPAAR